MTPKEITRYFKHRQQKYIDGTRWKTKPRYYCNNPIHRGYLSSKLMKKKKCKDKGCSYLQDLERGLNGSLTARKSIVRDPGRD